MENGNINFTHKYIHICVCIPFFDFNMILWEYRNILCLIVKCGEWGRGLWERWVRDVFVASEAEYIKYVDEYFKIRTHM